MQHLETMLSREEIFEGRVVRVTRDTVRLENGNEALREVVHHNGGAAVVPLTDDGQVILVRQYRYALGCELIEIPAGKLELGEDPFEAAKRELREETGCTAAEYHDLGFIIPTCGYCTERIYLYAAKGLTRHAQQLDEDEFVSVFTLELGDAVEKVLAGEITDSKTAVALLKLQALRTAGVF